MTGSVNLKESLGNGVSIGNHLGQVGLRGIFVIELAEMGRHTLNVGDTLFWDEPWTGVSKLSTGMEMSFHCSDLGCEGDVASYQITDTCCLLNNGC